MTNEAKPTGNRKPQIFAILQFRSERTTGRSLYRNRPVKYKPTSGHKDKEQKSTSEIQINWLVGTKIKNRNQPAKYKQTD